MKKIKVTGLMSGTSLDGLDIACCEFWKKNNKWHYTIHHAVTVPYSEERKKSFTQLMSSSAEEISFAHASYGTYLGEQVLKFLKKKNFKTALISSHGHTIFHQPKRGFTLQIGSGASIYAATNIPVVCDFRSVDVSMGGQGAPLVPIGDKLLFPDYDFCLNLGGISNISFDAKGKRMAYDISPVNIVLNYLAGLKNLPYDRNGSLADSGKVDEELLARLNGLSYYAAPFPKSLGKEWIDENVFPLITSSSLSVEDKLATFCEHTAYQIAVAAKKHLPASRKGKATLLVTGGGAFNKFLIQKISEHVEGNIRVVVPDKNTVMFKEALIFAFLGILRMRNEPNALRLVTGSSKDNIGGALYGPINVSFLS